MHKLISPAAGRLPYKLTNDILFYIVMTRSPNCLRRLLAAILSVDPESITDIEILNPLDYYEKVNAKKIILDIKVEINHNSIIDIEMQVLRQPYWNMRSLFYSSRLIAGQNADYLYSNIKSVHQIGILNFRQPDNNAFYQRYLLTSEDGTVFSEGYQIHTLNLKNIENATEEDDRYKRILWGRLFTAETWEEVMALAELDPVFGAVGEEMKRAMTKEDYLLQMREDAIRDYEFGLNGAWEEGHSKGLEQGVEQGLEKGRIEGVFETLISLVKDGILTTTEAADRAGVPEAVLRQRMDREE